MTTAEAIENVTEPILPESRNGLLVTPQHIEAARKAAAGLRDLANFIEQHPEVNVRWAGWSFNLFPGKLADIARAGFGTLKKTVKGDWYCLTKEFGPVSLEFNEKREAVCTKVKVGEKIIPATPEQTIVIPAKPEKVEEIFEWKCPDSLLRDDGTRPPIRQADPTDPTDSASLVIDPNEPFPAF